MWLTACDSWASCGFESVEFCVFPDTLCSLVKQHIEWMALSKAWVKLPFWCALFKLHRRLVILITRDEESTAVSVSSLETPGKLEFV